MESIARLEPAKVGKTYHKMISRTANYKTIGYGNECDTENVTKSFMYKNTGKYITIVITNVTNDIISTFIMLEHDTHNARRTDLLTNEYTRINGCRKCIMLIINLHEDMDEEFKVMNAGTILIPMIIGAHVEFT